VRKTLHSKCITTFRDTKGGDGVFDVPCRTACSSNLDPASRERSIDEPLPGPNRESSQSIQLVATLTTAKDHEQRMVQTGQGEAVAAKDIRVQIQCNARRQHFPTRRSIDPDARAAMRERRDAARSGSSVTPPRRARRLAASSRPGVCPALPGTSHAP